MGGSFLARYIPNREFVKCQVDKRCQYVLILVQYLAYQKVEECRRTLGNQERIKRCATSAQSRYLIGHGCLEAKGKPLFMPKPLR
jgi:hypothetical protein